MLVFEWDDAKREANYAHHKVRFETVENANWDSARYFPDQRRNYQEGRILAYFLIEDRLHAMVFTIRKSGVRIISLRRANNREIDRYVEELNRS